MGDHNRIPDSIINEVNDDASTRPFEYGDLCRYAASNWIDAVGHGAMNTGGKKKIIAACHGQAEYLPLLASLIIQKDFGVALAQEIRSDSRWTELQDIISASRINDASTDDLRVVRLGDLLSSRKLFLWAVRIILSRRVIRGLMMLYDKNNASVRLAAAQVIGSIQNDHAALLLIEALDDADEAVRDTALKSLRGMVSEERLLEITESRLKESEDLKSTSTKARDQLLTMASKVPGISPILNAFRALSVGDTVSSISRAASRISSSTISTISSAIGNIRQKSSEPNSPETSNGLIALCFALAWADGEMAEHEREALMVVAEEQDQIDSHLLRGLYEKPTLDEMRPHLETIENPESVLTQLLPHYDIDLGNSTSREWLMELSKILSIDISYIERSS